MTADLSWTWRSTILASGDLPRMCVCVSLRARTFLFHSRDWIDALHDSVDTFIGTRLCWPYLWFRHLQQLNPSKITQSSLLKQCCCSSRSLDPWRFSRIHGITRRVPVGSIQGRKSCCARRLVWYSLCRFRFYKSSVELRFLFLENGLVYFDLGRIG